MESQGSDPSAPSPIVDPGQFSEFVALTTDVGGAAMIAELVEALEKDLTTSFELIEEGVQAGNAEQARRGAHKIRGSTSEFGSIEVVDLAGAFEAKCRSGQAPSREEADALRAATTRLVAFVREKIAAS